MKTCYDCSRKLSSNEVVRRDVIVSRGRTYGTITGQGGYDPVVLATANTGRVDLCQCCADERDRQEAARRKLFMRVLWLGALLFLVAGVALVAVIAVATWPAHVR